MTDKEQIDQLCKSFFDLFTNLDGKVFDVDRIYSLCIPETIIIKKEGQAEAVFNLASFIEPRKKILTNGTLTDFTEWETGESTTISNNIAQRISRYKKTGKMNSVTFNQEGTKLFQFIKTNNEWKITSLVWEDF